MIYYLQCPRCSAMHAWDQADRPEPGRCLCEHSKRYRETPVRAPYHVVTKERYDAWGRGFARLLTDDGYIELKGPTWSERDGRRVVTNPKPPASVMNPKGPPEERGASQRAAAPKRP